MAKTQIRSIVDIVLQLGVLALLFGWCFQILKPFINPVLWGIIIAIALDPLYYWISKRLKGKRTLSSIVLTLMLLVLVAIPSYFVFKSAFHGIKQIKVMYDNDEIQVGRPSESIKDWPLVGEKVYEFWYDASEDFEGLLIKYEDEIVVAAKYVFKALAHSGEEILIIMLSLVIAGVLLATRGTRAVTEAIFSRLAGVFGLEFAKITEQTIKIVVKGVIGVAFIQSLLIGLGFFLAGVPYAGLWTLLVLVLSIVQLPSALVTIPIIVYLFYSDHSTAMAIVWTIYLMAASLSDNILKPILMGKGGTVPTLILFIGSMGGFMAFGFIGLFVGAIVLSIMYRLFITWLDTEGENESREIELKL